MNEELNNAEQPVTSASQLRDDKKIAKNMPQTGASVELEFIPDIGGEQTRGRPVNGENGNLRADLKGLKNRLCKWSNHYFGGFLSGVMLAVLSYGFKNTEIPALSVLYENFGKDFLHHYVDIPLGLFYFMVLLAGLTFVVNEVLGRWIRKYVLGSLNNFLFHVSAISSGVLIVKLLMKFLGFADEYVDPPWALLTIGIMFAVSMLYSVMLHYLDESVEWLAKLRKNPDDGEKKFFRASILLLIVTMLLAACGGYALTTLS